MTLGVIKGIAEIASDGIEGNIPGVVMNSVETMNDLAGRLNHPVCAYN